MPGGAKRPGHRYRHPVHAPRRPLARARPGRWLSPGTPSGGSRPGPRSVEFLVAEATGIPAHAGLGGLILDADVDFDRVEIGGVKEIFRIRVNARGAHP